MKSSAEIGVEIDQKEKELREALEMLETIRKKDNEFARKMLLLRLERKDLEPFLLKGKHNIKLLQLDIRSLTAQFWNSKNSGL